MSFSNRLAQRGRQNPQKPSSRIDILDTLDPTASGFIDCEDLVRFI